MNPPGETIALKGKLLMHAGGASPIGVVFGRTNVKAVTHKPCGRWFHEAVCPADAATRPAWERDARKAFQEALARRPRT